MVCDFRFRDAAAAHTVPTARQVGDPAGPTSIISLGPAHHRFSYMLDSVEDFDVERDPEKVWARTTRLALPRRRRAHPRRHLHVPLPGHRPVAGRARPARRRRRAPDAAVPRAGHVLGDPRRPEHRVQARRRPAGPARRRRPRHLPAGARAPRPRGDREGHRARTPADGARPGARRRARPRPARAAGGRTRSPTPSASPGWSTACWRRRRGPGAGSSRCRASSTTARCATGSTRSSGPGPTCCSTPAASPSTRTPPRPSPPRASASSRCTRDPRPAAVVDIAGTHLAWLASLGVVAAAVRPDLYVFGTATDAGTTDALRPRARRGARRAQPGPPALIHSPAPTTAGAPR